MRRIDGATKSETKENSKVLIERGDKINSRKQFINEAAREGKKSHASRVARKIYFGTVNLQDTLEDTVIGRAGRKQ